MKWETDQDERLKALVLEGLSASQIAKEMRLGLTRNAIIGRISRMGLHLQLSRPSAPGMRRARPPKPPPAPRPAKPREMKTKPEPAEAPPPKRRATGPPALPGNHQCKWPFGDPGDDDFHFCPERAIMHGDTPRPYCAAHWKAAHQPVAPKDLTRMASRLNW